MTNAEKLEKDLKPCPFCGKLPSVIHQEEFARNLFRVECRNIDCHIICRTFTYSTTEEDAIKSWNRRSEVNENAEIH